MVAEICRQEEFEGVLLNVVEDAGQEWFTAEDIGKGLGFSEPAKSILNLFRRNKDEFEGFSQIINLMFRAKTVNMPPHRIRVFNAEGAMILGFFANTPKAKAFRRWASRFLTIGVEKLKAHVLKLEAANRKLSERSNVKVLPAPERKPQKRFRDLEEKLKQTKQAALELIEQHGQTNDRLRRELYTANQKIAALQQPQIQRLHHQALKVLNAMRELEVELLALPHKD